MSYQTEYTASIESPETFWAEQANQLPWYTAPTEILSKDDNGMDRFRDHRHINDYSVAFRYPFFC